MKVLEIEEPVKKGTGMGFYNPNLGKANNDISQQRAEIERMLAQNLSYQKVRLNLTAGFILPLLTTSGREGQSIDPQAPKARPEQVSLSLFLFLFLSLPLPPLRPFFHDFFTQISVPDLEYGAADRA